MPQTILIADDHRLLREGLRALLEREGFQVVAEADNGRSAVRLAKQLQPDIVITDIAMPDLNGVEATRQICAEAPRSKVLALSMHTESRFVLGILEAGASGYLLKDVAFEELSVAIKAVLKDQIYLSPAIAGAVVNQSVGALRSKIRPRPELSKRELEVLQLIAEGKSTKEIAATLHVSVKTVETHRKQIMDKLGVYSVAELTKYAIREGVTFL
ncbi:MAG TPA: response regulator transcription factor [Candidatus Binatia bacterium]|jgi:DNA-binding NarL/FixJ family response regulator